MRVRERHISKIASASWKKIVQGSIIVMIPESESENGTLNIARETKRTPVEVENCDIAMSSSATQRRTGASIECDAEVHIRYGETLVHFEPLCRINIGGTLSNGDVIGGEWFILKSIAECDFLIRKFLGFKLVLQRDK